MHTVSVWSALAWRDSMKSQIARTGALASLWCALSFGQLVLAASSTPAANPPACINCHAGVTSSYSHAAMYHALEIPSANPTLESHPNLSVQQGNYLYTVQTKDGHSTYSVSDGTNSITVPIRWIFGQHSQTWVLEKNGAMYESLVSYFQQEQELATTPGDGHVIPRDLTEAFGRKLSKWEAIQCFSCHATDSAKGENLNLESLRPGVGCERCHAGANQHMADAVRNNFSSLPKSLKAMNAEDTANFCGQCHRTWDATVRNRFHGPVDVRFQPYRLSNSRCFVGSDKRISCLACHNPHEQANHNLISYDAKCLACHGKTAASGGSSVKSCPVSTTNCVSCHMPRIPLPGGHAVFTDHLIRIVRPGEPYPD
jgi:hypothetical protein